MSCRRPDQHLGTLGAGGQRRCAGTGEPDGVAGREWAGPVEGGRTASDEDVHVSVVGDLDALAGAQSSAPEHRSRLADRDGRVVSLAGRDRDEPTTVELGVDADQWARLLNPLVRMQQIFMTVYRPDGPGPYGFCDYASANWSPAKMVDEAFKQRLRAEHAGMSVPELEHQAGRNAHAAFGAGWRQQTGEVWSHREVVKQTN